MDRVIDPYGAKVPVSLSPLIGFEKPPTPQYVPQPTMPVMPGMSPYMPAYGAYGAYGYPGMPQQPGFMSMYQYGGASAMPLPSMLVQPKQPMPKVPTGMKQQPSFNYNIPVTIDAGYGDKKPKT